MRKRNTMYTVNVKELFKKVLENPTGEPLKHKGN